MRNFKTINDVNLENKRALIRLDLNMPMKNGVILDYSRIERSIPTLKKLTSQKAKVIIISHLGRPEGKFNSKMSLEPIASALKEILNHNIRFVSNCTGKVAQNAAQGMEPGDIILLENLRFFEGEEKNDPKFSKKLASLGDVYINDAFSCSHRAHASTIGIPNYLEAVAGPQMENEINALSSALIKAKHPIAAIIGGSKISTKIEVLLNLLPQVEFLIIGGGMANTFLFSKGFNIQKSLCEKGMVNEAKKVLNQAEKYNCEIILPVDGIVAKQCITNIDSKEVFLTSVPQNTMILDIGHLSRKKIKDCLKDCRTVLWNGPLGAFETSPFDSGTNEIAAEIARLTSKNKLLSVAGGGDTLAAIAKSKTVHSFSYLSAAGGAFLEWLEGKDLPGIIPLIKSI